MAPMRLVLNGIGMLALVWMAAPTAAAERSCDAILAENRYFCVAPAMAPGLPDEETAADQTARWEREEQENKDRNRCCCPPACDRKPTKKVAVPGTLRVCPQMPKAPETVGLIAAVHGTRAEIFYAGTPDVPVIARIESTGLSDVDFDLAAREKVLADPHLDADYQPAGRFRGRTDASGRLTLLVRMRIYPGRRLEPLATPGEVRVVLREKDGVGDTVATIRVGLGVRMLQDRLISVSTDSAQRPHHLWRAMVASRFYPDMDLQDYADRAFLCDEYLPRPIVNIQSIALNFSERNDQSPLHDGIGGLDEDTAPNAAERLKYGQKFTFGRDPAGANYLRPHTLGQRQPIVRIKDDLYPAVSQNAGIYAKSYFGFLRLEERSPNFVYSQDSLEPRVMDSHPIIFSMEDTESWYRLALCSVEAKSADQMLFLAGVSLIPVVGDGTDLSLGVVGALCEAVKGRYQAAFTRLGLAIGKVGLGKLVKEGLIPKAAEGSWHPKFYRALGMDPTDLSAHERKAMSEAMGVAYDLTVNALEKSNWTPPK